MSFLARMPVAGTRPERALIAAVRRVTGEELVLQAPHLPGTPDVVVPGRRAVLFSHGCYWHWHGPDCPLSRVPETSFDWPRKFAENRARDRRVREELLSLGYRVLTVWECAVRGAGALPRVELDAIVAQFLVGTTSVVEVEGREVEARRALRRA